MKKRPLISLGLAMAAAAVVVMAAPDLQAYPDAKVEAQTRPNFGLLIDPPLRRGKPRRPRGRRSEPGPGGWWDERPPHFDGRLEPVVFVDCSRARSPNDINHALERLEPGGTLVLRTDGDRGCLDHVRIRRPVTIEGVGGQQWLGPPPGHYGNDALTEGLEDPVPDDAAAAPPPDDAGFEGAGEYDEFALPRRRDISGLTPHLKVPPGRGCIDIAPGAGKVVLRNLVISQPAAGSEACIYAERADLVLENTVVRYSGDGPAIVVEGGSLTIGQGTVIDAATTDRAIYAERAKVSLANFVITGNPSIGVEVVAPLDRSEIRDVEFWSRPTSSHFGTPQAGIVISGGSTLGRMQITRARVCGFNIGIWHQGANTTNIRGGQICQSRKGIVFAGGNASVIGTTIGANLIGVEIGDARVELRRLSIYGAAYADVFVLPGGTPPTGEGSYFYSHSNTYCRWTGMDERHPDYRRWKRRGKRERHLQWMPNYNYYGGTCRDPRELDARWLEYERRLGYRDGQYRMDPWIPPEQRYDGVHREYGPDGKPAANAAP